MKPTLPERKKMMSEALYAAAFYFSNDKLKTEAIAAARKELDGDREDALSEVCQFVCGLDLIVIAETGFDLNKTPYFTRYPELPSRYIAHAHTPRGYQVLVAAQRAAKEGCER